jgi:hypothetical protein
LHKLIIKEAKRFEQYQKDFREELDTELKALIKAQLIRITDASHQSAASNALKKPLSISNKENYYDEIDELSDGDLEVQAVYDQVKEFAKLKQKEFQEAKASSRNKVDDYGKQFFVTNHSRLTLFAFGGINAIGFKRFTGIDSTDLSKSITDVGERGGQFGLGINYQWRNIWLGFTFSRSESNNFTLLKKKEYTLQNTVTIAPNTLIEETKITAYSGEYGKVDLSNVNVDIVARIRLDKEYKNYLLWNPYLRASVASSNTLLLPNKTNVGMGAYFLPNNSKFLGGIYLELPDLNNNVEKMKEAAEQNLRPPFKRLSFGIVTKFSLSTIMNW